MTEQNDDARWTTFKDDLTGLRLGFFPHDYSPLGEYHDIRDRPATGWRELTLHHSWRRLPRWLVGEEQGVPYVHQTSFNEHGLPMLGTGESDWRDYVLSVEVRRFSPDGLVGIAFRVEDPRHWIGLYMEGDRLILARQEDDAREELAHAPLPFSMDRWYRLTLKGEGDRISAALNGDDVLAATVKEVTTGRIALIARVPGRFRRVRVERSASEVERLDELEARRRSALRRRKRELPQPVLWRRFATPGFGVGKSVRFGDLDGDGQPEMLLAQNLPLSGYDFDGVSCLTAIRQDGRILWQKGTPDPDCGLLTNDVAVQIHDIDGDGKQEVVYTKDFYVVIVDGATGKEKCRFPTPIHGENHTWLKEHLYHRIIGDSLYFCDLDGIGAKRNLLIKDRYNNLWAYGPDFDLRWHWGGKTGHYPFALDVNGDERDEVLVGYSLLDADGNELWTLEGIDDHADGVAIAPLGPNGELRAVFACSDEGMVWATLDGQILRHDRVGHAQCCHVASLDPTRDGYEVATTTFWGEPGIIVIYDREGTRLTRFSPFPMGSHLSPTNWTGDGQEHLLLSAMPQDGGLWNAHGEQVVPLPDDGHPTLCCEPIDLTGDARDEIVVWDTKSVWIYTQDRPFDGERLYTPQRNAHANFSNYRSIVSLPAWDER